MLDSIFIGTSGLLGHAKGLRIVGNNLANVNTSGFKSSTVQFSDLFDQGQGAGGMPATPGASSSLGMGLNTLGSSVNFNAGIGQATGNALNLSINGDGFFVVKRNGQFLYTRAGDFKFNSSDILVNANGDHVQGLDSTGKLSDINLSTTNYSRNAAKATSNMKFHGNLSNATVPATGSISASVFDSSGAAHNLTISMSATATPAGSNNADTVNVAITEGATTWGTGTFKFTGGIADPVANSFTINYTPTGLSAMAIKLDFSNMTFGASSGNSVALAMESQDGYTNGVKTTAIIGDDGTVKISYTNNQTADGPKLAMANFPSQNDLDQSDGKAFAKKLNGSVIYGFAKAGGFGSLVSGQLEASNVDLAEEFGNLILMQRGYQASSHLISTANDMIQELFDMKGHR